MAETPGKLFTLLAQITRDGEEGRTWAEEDRMDREEPRDQTKGTAFIKHLEMDEMAALPF